MIRNRPVYYLLALIPVCWANLALSGDKMPVPQRNPFKFPQPSPARPSVVGAEQEEPLILQLRATLVSEDAPLAVVGERVLGIGDEIKGYRLLLVREGEATFVGKGRRLTLRVGLDQAEDHAD